MLKKLLLNSQLLQKLRGIKTPEQKNPEESQQNQSNAPDLLDPSLNTKRSHIQRAGSFLPIVVGTIVVMNVAQISLLLWHATQNNHTTKLKNMLTIAHQKFLPEERSWTQIEQVMQKIAMYKQVKATRKNTSSQMNTIIEGLPYEIALIDIGYFQGEVTIIFDAESILSFTKVVNNYLTDPNIEKIELRAASLNTSVNSYTIEAGVVFK